MNSRRFLRAVVVILTAAMLPASTAAAADHYIAPPGYTTTVELQGSNGYAVKIIKGHPRRIAVRVENETSRTLYSYRGAENGRYGLDARLPGFGRVRFRFVPNGRQRRIPPPPECEGPPGLLLDGVVRGRIRFTGENGYTRVAVDRARAEVETWPRMRCRYQGGGGKSDKWTAVFNAFRESPPHVGFTARRYAKQLRPSSRRVEFQARTFGSQSLVRISRIVSVTAGASSFVLHDPKAAPENFTLAPPPPFSGTATFQRTPESVFSWEGDLSVQFPGIGAVALAGPEFNARYCALRGCISQASATSP